MALTKVTGQVINNSTGLVVGVTTVGGGVSAVDGFFSGIVTFSQGVSIGGTLTYEDVTNIDSVGLITARAGVVVGSGITLSKDGDIFATGITTVSGNVKVGTGITLSPDGDGFFTGVVTATSYAGDGSALTGISVDSTQIVTGNTSVQTVDTGSDGHVKVNTEGSERLRIDSAGNMGLGITPDTQGNTVDSLQIGSATNLYNESSDDYTILGNNVYFDGTNNKYIKTQESSRLMLNAGEFTFNQAASGSADANITYTTALKIDSNGHVLPGANDTYDLGSSSLRWRDIYTGDLNLSNEGKTNDVDGTWGNYTIQEGENDLFLINNRSGKKYKFNLTEVS